MRTVHQLNGNELQELRETYFRQLEDTAPDVLCGINSSDQIDMVDVKNHYENVMFSDDDFFCNL
jgi:hypothetical protein